jgi:hypothetical protein
LLTRLRAFGPITRAAIAIAFLAPVPASAQDVTEPALKAAFVYNFAKFTEWPAEVARVAGPLSMCVVGDARVGEALTRTVRDRELSGRRMVVSILGVTEPQRGCHILYVSGVTAGQAALLIADLRDLPVLTISDAEGFMALGGIAQFFFDNGRLRFRVHLGSVKRARLQISSRLLALAKPHD